MNRRNLVITHALALVLLGTWGILVLGMAGGTLGLAFWVAWLVYAAFLALMARGSAIGSWLVAVPPLLWAAFSGSDIVPQMLLALDGRSVSSEALTGALLITGPCGAAVFVHLCYVATVCRSWWV